MSSIATAATTAFNNNNSSAYVGKWSNLICVFRLVFIDFIHFPKGITSGRGHAQSEVGIAWIDIESVREVSFSVFRLF